MEEHHNLNKILQQSKRQCFTSSTFCVSENIDQDCEQPEPDHAIFWNHLVTSEIFKNLNVEDLLSCRGVNLILNFGSNDILSKRNFLALTFQYDFHRKNYFWAQSYRQLTTKKHWTTNVDSDRIDTDLNTFTRLLASSPNFPCSSFRFWNGNLNDKPLQKFLTRHGKRIKELAVDVYCGQERAQEESEGLEDEEQYYFYDNSNVDPTRCIPKIETLRNLLIRQAPNLISLTIQNCPVEWETFRFTDSKRLFPCSNQTSSNVKVYLPYLKKLTYRIRNGYMSFMLVEDILRAAPYLECVDSECDTPMLNANKFHLMNFFEFYPSSDFIELYEKVLTNIQSCKLKRLNITLFPLIQTPIHQRSARSVLRSVLNASRSTLMNINLQAPLGLLGPDFYVPKCVNVKSITITTNKIVPFMFKHYDLPINRNPDTVKYFPQGFQFKECFPSLSHVTFSFQHVPFCSKWENFFYHLEPVPLVKSLVILKSSLMPANSIAYCSRIFSNVEFLNVQVKQLNFYESALNGLWDFNKLKEFNCDIYLSNCWNTFPYMDAAFTGFSLETSKRFRNALSLNEHDLNNLNNLRENPSILKLQELRQLRMRIIDESLESRDFYPTIFTQSTCVGAFFQLPLLQVFVQIKVGFEKNRIKILRAILGILPAVTLLESEVLHD